MRPRPAPRYRRAAELFEQATSGINGGPFTLHQLRHSALTHAAESGANTATQLALSGHSSVASLAKYARVSREALTRWQQARDPTTREGERPARKNSTGTRVVGRCWASPDERVERWSLPGA